jgi:hypothetical protein
MRRKYQYSDPLHELSRTGQWVDVPRRQLFDELRRYGGYITFGDRMFAIAGACVHSIQLRPEALSHPFRTEADIEARLGPPSSVSGAAAVRVHRAYAEMGLTLTWQTVENRLDHVTVGPHEHLPQLLTRVEVLQNWLRTVDELQDGQLRRDAAHSTTIRYKRVTALLGAFGLGSPKEFSSGHFLREPLELYPLSVAAVQRSNSFQSGRAGDVSATEEQPCVSPKHRVTTRLVRRDR